MADIQQRIKQTALATPDTLDGALRKPAPPPASSRPLLPPDLLANLTSERKRKRRQ